MTTFETHIFEAYYSYFDKLTDPNKDVNNKGTTERFMETIGADIDKYITPFIANMQADIVDPMTMLASQLPYAEQQEGYSDDWEWFFNSSTTFRRGLLRIMPTLLQIKGTKWAYRIMFAWLGVSVTVLEDFADNGGFDSPTTFDSPTRRFDSRCFGCINYRVYLTYPTNVTLSPTTLMAIKTILLFNYSAGSKLIDVTFNGVSIAASLNIDAFKLPSDFSDALTTSYNTFKTAVLSDGGTVATDGEDSYNRAGYVAKKKAKLLVVPGHYKSGVIYGLRPTTGAKTNIPYTRTGVATVLDSAGYLQTVAANLPRLHYPSIGQPSAYLFEEAVTNLWTGADLFERDPIFSNCTNVADASILSGAQVVSHTGYNTGYNYAFTNGVYTLSVYVKRGNGAMAALQARLTFSSPAVTVYLRAQYNFDTGVITAFEDTGNYHGVVQGHQCSATMHADGWVRISMSWEVISGTTSGSMVGLDGNHFVSGDSFLATCPQYEQGYLTSYVPSPTGVQGARGADSISLSGLVAAGVTGSAQGSISVYGTRRNIFIETAPSLVLSGTGTNYDVFNCRELVGNTVGEQINLAANNSKYTVRWLRNTPVRFTSLGVTLNSPVNTPVGNVDNFTYTGKDNYDLYQLAIYSDYLTEQNCIELTTL